MKTEDLRGKTVSELKESILSSRRELLNLRFQQVSGQLQSPAQLRTTRRNIARMKTLMHKKNQNTSKEK